MKIRKARITDIKQIMDGGKDFDKMMNSGGPLDRLHPKRNSNKKNGGYYRGFIKKKNRWLYVAEEGGKILGFTTLYLMKREPFWNVDRVGHIDLVYVFKNARKKGIAKLLVKKAEEVFRKKRIKYLHLSNMSAHKEANAVWKKLGFKEYMIKMYRKVGR